jgi:hypothetical protein
MPTLSRTTAGSKSPPGVVLRAGQPRVQLDSLRPGSLLCAEDQIRTEQGRWLVR